MLPVQFYGKVEEKWVEGTKTFTWTPDEMVSQINTSLLLAQWRWKFNLSIWLLICAQMSCIWSKDSSHNLTTIYNLLSWEQVEAVAYDNPIPGYNTGNTINLRLWAAKPSGEFDLVCGYKP